MKAKLLSLLLLVAMIFTMNSCSSDSDETTSTEVSTQKVSKYTYSYNTTEIETMALVNAHRVSIGLKELKGIDYISIKSDEHNNYMITNNVVSHDGFVTRSESIMQVIGAKNVSENIAYNYNSPQSALTAWLKSPSHKANIEGNYTHFGLSVKVSADGKKYYTNIFAKI